MYGHDVGPAEQLVLCDKGRARGLRGLGRHVLAPGDDFHAEGEANAGDLSADIA